MVTITILDGYIDEPTCLGVPPYLSPYPRYLAGALWTMDSSFRIVYMTIDQLRSDSHYHTLLEKSDCLFVLAGTSVPGRYLAGYPISKREVLEFIGSLSHPIKFLFGPAARYGFGGTGGKTPIASEQLKTVFDGIIDGDSEIVVKDLVQETFRADRVDLHQTRLSSDDITSFAIRGAQLVEQHPFFPDHLICEIETYRGCSRCIVGGCSFCSEPEKGIPQFRSIQAIHNEIRCLAQAGIVHFRIGNQPCIFSYMAKGVGQQEFPTPNPDALQKLFAGIRQAAPTLQTLHIDNANPGILARYPEQCRTIAKSIIRYHTSGDVAALGVESADPEVIKRNNLKASSTDVLAAIRLLNDVGAMRGSSGLPELLPGLNFVFGLPGESKHTFSTNYEFLQSLYDKHLLVRRINLRQVIPLPGTRLYAFGERNVIKHKSIFKQFKRKVQHEIERPLLQRLIPQGVVMTRVYTEKHDGKLTLGRQMGSYPILVGIPGIYPLGTFFDVKIVDHGYRSITGVPYPLDFNTSPSETLEALPGIGKKRALRLLRHRPYENPEEILAVVDDPKIGRKLFQYL